MTPTHLSAQHLAARRNGTKTTTSPVNLGTSYLRDPDWMAEYDAATGPTACSSVAAFQAEVSGKIEEITKFRKQLLAAEARQDKDQKRGPAKRVTNKDLFQLMGTGWWTAKEMAALTRCRVVTTARRAVLLLDHGRFESRLRGQANGFDLFEYRVKG